MFTKRYFSLDAMRGFAVLGILLMNVVAFALPISAYINPLASGHRGTADLAAWAISFVLIDGKMRGMFSLLFGASMLLIINHAEAQGKRPLLLHARRMAWLFAFGLLHYAFIWDGDILSLYALCGLVAYSFRHLTAKQLALLGATLIFANLIIWALVMATAHHLRQEALALGTSAAEAAYLRMADALGDPAGASISTERTLYARGYLDIFAHRLSILLRAPFQLAYAHGLETMGLMAWGMALLKSGAVTGQWPHRKLLIWGCCAYAFGLPLSAYLALLVRNSGFDVLITADVYYVLATPARMSVMIGHVMLLLLIVDRRAPGIILSSVAAAGRMAFTNYILMSVLMTTWFYGYGFGHYGQASRAEVYWTVPPIWGLMLLWSPLWLKYFRYGPMEWLWRSLTQRHLQPMRIK